MLLNVEQVHTFYGTFQALRGVSLDVNAGEVVTILGANGAGKSTLLRTISGLIRSKSGNIRYQGERINGVTPEVIVRLGISHCPEGRMLFPEMPVYKNLELGAYVRRKDRSHVERMKQEVYELFPIVDERKKQPAGTLSGGEQQMLAIARALMATPKLLLLDEPSVGLAPRLIDEIFEKLADLKRRGIALLLV